MEDILTVILIFGGGACIAMAFSPIGRAVADRIRGKSASGGGGDLRTELAEKKDALDQDRKSTRLNSSHGYISYAVFCLKKKKKKTIYIKHKITYISISKK